MRTGNKDQKLVKIAESLKSCNSLDLENTTDLSIIHLLNAIEELT